MLHELDKPRQNINENRRRIFFDNFFDLYVWFDENDKIAGFQLCYDKYGNERAITWREETGYFHNRVDDGESGYRNYKMKPVLIDDGVFDYKEIALKFRVASRDIDRYISNFVYMKLLKCRDVNG